MIYARQPSEMNVYRALQNYLIKRKEEHMPKFVTLEEAVSHIKDNDSLIIGGFGSYGSPEELITGVQERYAADAHPKNLTVICGIAPGDKLESTEPYKGYNLGVNKIGRASCRERV